MRGELKVYGNQVVTRKINKIMEFGPFFVDLANTFISITHLAFFSPPKNERKSMMTMCAILFRKFDLII